MLSHCDYRRVAAEIAALDRLLADERARVERDPGTAGQQPDKHQLPAHIQARPRLLHRLLTAQCLEGVISATGKAADRRHRILRARVDRAGRAQRPERPRARQ